MDSRLESRCLPWASSAYSWQALLVLLPVLHLASMIHGQPSLASARSSVRLVSADANHEAATDTNRGRAAASNIHFRGKLTNALHTFSTQDKGHVAFIGGSITEMNGYRPLVCELLQRRFPKSEFLFTNAGIASTCSTTGAFRLQRDVLNKGRVDLLFVEFAVNDQEDAQHTRRECIRGLEGIVRSGWHRTASAAPQSARGHRDHLLRDAQHAGRVAGR